MATSSIGLPMAAIINLEVLAAYGIAINLAYLNLPNLRFPERIKAKIRQVLSRYDKEDFSRVQKNTSKYRTIYDLANLQEFPYINEPEGDQLPYRDSSFSLDVFMYVWCTQVRIPGATQPIDKLISAVFLCISNFYLYYFATIQTNPDLVGTLHIMFIIFSLSIGLLIIISWTRRDFVTTTIAAISLVAGILGIYAPGSPFIPLAANAHTMIGLLSASVLTTSLLVVLSHMIYPSVEKRYVEHTIEIMEEAKTKGDPQDHQ